MLDALIQLSLFAAKAIIIIMVAAILLSLFLGLILKGKEKIKNKLVIKNLNKKYDEMTETLSQEILPKKQFKKFLKEKKAHEKLKNKHPEKNKNIFLLNFDGDIKASAVTTLREEISAILSVATPDDEVVLRLESGGGLVNGYGLAAAQLMRLRAKHIPLTVTIDKIAASGGYMMACVANKILAAPFAIIGSIGVIVQLPNFHRLLKDKHIDFEQLTAGNYKRTLTVFGENTPAGREKLKEELEDIHASFKNLITEYRKDIDIQQVSTGEHWLGNQALALRLVDDIQTSDDYLQNKAKVANLYELCFEVKKPLASRLAANAHAIRERFFSLLVY